MPAFLQATASLLQSFTSSKDILIITLLIGGSVISTFLLGRKLTVATLVSLYIAAVVTSFFPFSSLIASALPASTSVVKIIVFVIMVAVSTMLIVRSRLRYMIDRHERIGVGHAFILSLLEVGMLIMLLLVFAPASFVADLRPLTAMFFASSTAQFIWVTLPIIAMVSLKR